MLKITHFSAPASSKNPLNGDPALLGNISRNNVVFMNKRSQAKVSTVYLSDGYTYKQY